MAAMIFFADLAGSAEVDLATAKLALRGWLNEGRDKLDERFVQQTADAADWKTEASAAGRPLFHVANLTAGGFAVLAGDNRITPVIAFSGEGKFRDSPDSPLYDILKGDLAGRLAAVEAAANPNALAGNRQVQALSTAATAQWQKLLTLGKLAPSARSIQGLDSVSDLRRAALVQSKWNQATADYAPSSEYLYNYYTPNHYYSGCTATAFAQVLRFWQHPIAGVGVKSFAVKVDGNDTTLSTRGGDGVGGAYNWSLMALVPAAGLAESNRQAIGALCYDAGVTVQMLYTSSASSGSVGLIPESIKSVFSYQSAACYACNGDSDSIDETSQNQIINSNLDAQRPMILHIGGVPGGLFGGVGHAVVGDGYGYQSSISYTHLNFGWGGYNDAWYNLPGPFTVPYGSFDTMTFKGVVQLVYNIRPSGTGEIVSGRITNGDGQAVAGAQVSASGTGYSHTVFSDANGIYVFDYAPSNTTLNLSAAYGSSLKFSPITVTTGISQNSSIPYTYGNIWGVDFIIPQITVSASDASASEAGPDTGTFTITRTGNTLAALTAAFSLGGTAGSADYTASANSSVTIPAGSSSATVTITPLADAELQESNETVVLTLTANSAAYSLGSASSATVTIANSTLPNLTVTATDVAASEEGPDTGTFTITRTGNTTMPLTVSFTFSGTADSSDYNSSASASVTIPAGSSSVTVTITPIDDSVDEDEETVVLAIADSSYYHSGASKSATVVIGDNDDNGIKKWSYTNPGCVFASPAISSDGTVYVLSFNGVLSAINSEGVLKWSYSVGGDYNVICPAVGADGTVYVTSGNSLYSISSIGNLKWVYTAGGKFWSAPAISTEGIIYSGTSYPDYKLYAFYPDGNIKWAHASSIGNSLYGTAPAISSNGDIYVGVSGKLYALDSTGTVKWAYCNSSAISTGIEYSYWWTSPSVDSDGTIYVGSEDRNLYAFDSNGAVKWKYATNKSITSSPIIGKDAIYFGSEDYKLYALGRSGSLKWTYTTGNKITTSSPAIGADDTIYVGSNDYKLYALSAEGNLKWSFITGGNIQHSPAIGADGTIYIGSNDNKLYAISSTCGTLADTPWPMFGRDARHTGRTCNFGKDVAVTVAATDSAAAEAASNPGVFTLSRTGSTAANLTVSFTLGGTAGGGDYTASASSSVTIPAGSSSATVTITPIDDSVDDDDETVILTLAGETDYTPVAPNSATVVIADNDDPEPVTQFVTRFYQLCLLRDPDAAGLNGWVANLKSSASTGADVATGFIFSAEFQARGLSDSAWLDVLYQAFFNRAADPAGKNGWLTQMAGGTSRLAVMDGFAKGQEFINLCSDYGIKPYAGYGEDPVAQFVTRFYQLCLNRDADSAGLNGWTNNLKNGVSTGADVGTGFVFSAEMQARNLSDSDWLDVLYQAFFNRAADAAGKNAWLSQMNAGTSKLAVLDGFTHGAEFSALCAQYGITAY